jgi:hypothetical protein
MARTAVSRSRDRICHRFNRIDLLFVPVDSQHRAVQLGLTPPARTVVPIHRSGRDDDGPVDYIEHSDLSVA